MCDGLVKCKCGREPRMSTSTELSYGTYQKNKYWAQVKCDCGMQTKTVYENTIPCAKSVVRDYLE